MDGGLGRCEHVMLMFTSNHSSGLQGCDVIAMMTSQLCSVAQRLQRVMRR